MYVFDTALDHGMIGEESTEEVDDDIWRAGIGRMGLREEDLGFGFDDEEGVGGGVAGVAELLDGVVERGS